MEAVIFSNKRTGSTFLQEALDSHPDINAFDELFLVSTKEIQRRNVRLYKTMKQLEGYSIPKYLNWIASKGKNTVFRLMYNQNETWNVFPHIKDRKMKIIHLKRDPVDIVISILCKFSEGNDGVKVRKGEFEQMLNSYRELQNKYDKKLSGYDGLLEINYKDLFGKVEGERSNIENVGQFNIRSDQETYLNEKVNFEICKFLNVKPLPMKSKITKKFTIPREEKILNWNDIKRLI
jgi:hypothetical protein